MHIFILIIGVIIVLGLGFFLSPRGYINRKVNAAAWKRNDEGRGNFMTRPIWGKYAHRPDYAPPPSGGEGGQGDIMSGPEDSEHGTDD